MFRRAVLLSRPFFRSARLLRAFEITPTLGSTFFSSFTSKAKIMAVKSSDQKSRFRLRNTATEVLFLFHVFLFNVVSPLKGRSGFPKSLQSYANPTRSRSLTQIYTFWSQFITIYHSEGRLSGSRCRFFLYSIPVPYKVFIDHGKLD